VATQNLAKRKHRETYSVNAKFQAGKEVISTKIQFRMEEVKKVEISAMIVNHFNVAEIMDTSQESFRVSEEKCASKDTLEESKCIKAKEPKVLKCGGGQCIFLKRANLAQHVRMVHRQDLKCHECNFRTAQGTHLPH
jgi:hypothetical protein